MKTRVTLRPCQKGTRGLHEQYGDRLICVRYRYDPEGRRRLKTVEIIVDEKPWVSSPRLDPPSPPRIVHVHVNLGERELQARVKEDGGKWDPGRRLWALDSEAARRLNLENRIIHGSGQYIR